MPLKEETEPIADDEWLYRRVHTTRFRTAKTPFVSPGAFEPRTKGDHPDTDGISLFRAACLNEAGDILVLIEDPGKRIENGVVKVSVREFKSLGLSVVSTPRDNIFGHVSIPELSAGAYAEKSTRQKCKKWMTDLAELASPTDRIVLAPDPMNPRN